MLCSCNQMAALELKRGQMPISSPFPTEITTVCWWAEQQIEHFGGNSTKWQISMLATEGVRHYPIISKRKSGKKEVNGCGVSYGSRISNLFLQACCSTPLVLKITVDWLTVPWTTCSWLPQNDPTTGMLPLEQLVTGSAWRGLGYYS